MPSSTLLAFTSTWLAVLTWYFDMPALTFHPTLRSTVPELVHISIPHPLHSSNSPAVRSLPDYERHFQHHLMAGRALAHASEARLLR